jgi:hypothetical protein
MCFKPRTSLLPEYHEFSLDQTTRIHAPLLPSPKWHEVNRPQIHGYDLIDIVNIGNLCFGSIADEKVVRIFEAPKQFVKVMKELEVFDEMEEVRCPFTSVELLITRIEEQPYIISKATSVGSLE